MNLNKNADISIFLKKEGIARTLLKRGMGNGEWGMGNGEWGMGNGEWGMGNGEWGMGNGEWGMGNEEWGMGNGKLKMGNCGQRYNHRKVRVRASSQI